VIIIEKQKTMASLQALGSKDAKEILVKLRLVHKHADKEGCKHCDEILEKAFKDE
jgi:hypothetical protein